MSAHWNRHRIPVPSYSICKFHRPFCWLGAWAWYEWLSVHVNLLIFHRLKSLFWLWDSPSRLWSFHSVPDGLHFWRGPEDWVEWSFSLQDWQTASELRFPRCQSWLCFSVDEIWWPQKFTSQMSRSTEAHTQCSWTSQLQYFDDYSISVAIPVLLRKYHSS